MPELFHCAPTRFLAAILCVVSLATTGRAEDSDVVLNEVMYHAPFDLDDLQYIELFNRGDAPVDLSKWSFTKGIRFTFPDKTRLTPGGYQTRLTPGGYLVVCRKASIFSANYGGNIRLPLKYRRIDVVTARIGSRESKGQAQEESEY